MVSEIQQPRLEIHYCTKCRFILRASWLCQEVLMTFEEKLGECALIPADSGVFDVKLDGEIIYSKRKTGSFPESSELKQLIRDRIDPDLSLGHSDIK